MTPDELVEKVARIYQDAWGVQDRWRAREAIAVVLEEAARMIERRHGYGLSLQIAAEVRAMKGIKSAE